MASVTPFSSPEQVVADPVEPVTPEMAVVPAAAGTDQDEPPALPVEPVSPVHAVVTAADVTEHEEPPPLPVTPLAPAEDVAPTQPDPATASVPVDTVPLTPPRPDAPMAADSSGDLMVVADLIAAPAPVAHRPVRLPPWQMPRACPE
eukprot:3662768-Amphidinium_carterae.1